MGTKIEKDQIILSDLYNVMKFHWKRGKGHLIPYLWNRYQWYHNPKALTLSKYPLHVDVEISSICNMKCPMCYTNTEIFNKRVSKTLMNFELFKKIIDESANHNLFSIRLSLRGEALLNPNFLEMIKYAKEMGIKEVSTLTNGLLLDEDLFMGMVRNGLDWLTISIDGWGEKYEQIRKPAKFDEIYKRIMTFYEIKKKIKSVKPVIKVQSVWPAIQENPEYFYSLFRPYVDEVASNPLIDFLREDSDISYDEKFTCPYVWQRISIGADGNILMCQCDEMEENLLGNVSVDSIYNIWNGEELNNVRQIHKQKKGHLVFNPCKHCSYPRKKVEYEEIEVSKHKVIVEKYVGREDHIKIN
ncbi:MAG: radical SAM protein [Oligoflexia bacterium]|nr:radical SAM protein [Oligoflexia bacterium]